MKKIIAAILLSALIISCRSVMENKNADNQTEKKLKNKSNGSTEREAESFFELDGFEFSVDGEKSVEKEGIYDVMYDFKFFFKTNRPIDISFKIYDIDNNVLYEKDGIKTGGMSIEKKSLYLEEGFTDRFAHSMLLFSITVEINNKTYEYTGEYENTAIPSVEEFKTGPVITRYENKKTNVSLYADLKIKNCAAVSWIHLIPPGAGYYWSLQPKYDQGAITSSSIINDAKHINYIDNGIYILQINLGKLGIIQKEINVIDYLDNKTGPNYGLPVAGEKNSDKNNITLDMDFIDKLDYFEIALYADKSGNSEKLGTAKYAAPVLSLNKKELFELFFDIDGNRVKLKYNRKYYYRINSYSKEYNGLHYISISDPIPVIFPGFKLFDF